MQDNSVAVAETPILGPLVYLLPPDFGCRYIISFLLDYVNCVLIQSYIKVLILIIIVIFYLTFYIYQYIIDS